MIWLDDWFDSLIDFYTRLTDRWNDKARAFFVCRPLRVFPSLIGCTWRFTIRQTNSGGAGSTQDCEPGASNATKTLRIFDGDDLHHQQQQHQRSLKLPPLDITSFPVPDDGGSKGSRGRQRVGKRSSGSKGNRVRSASYGGTGSTQREGRQVR